MKCRVCRKPLPCSCAFKPKLHAGTYNTAGFKKMILDTPDTRPLKLTCPVCMQTSCSGCGPLHKAAEDPLTFAREYMGTITAPHTQAIDHQIEQLMRVKQEALKTMAVPMQLLKPRSGNFASAAVHQEMAVGAGRRSGKTRAVKEAAAMYAEAAGFNAPPLPFKAQLPADTWDVVQLDSMSEVRTCRRVTTRTSSEEIVEVRTGGGPWTRVRGAARNAVVAACAALVQARRETQEMRAKVLRIETEIAQRACALKLRLDEDEDLALDAG